MSSGPARVLELLRGAGRAPLSGEALRAELGVSRAQIWKHVETLRKRGYEVDGEPGGGYRLCGVPDRLYPEEIQADLGTRWLGCEIHYFDEVDSTNRVASELAASGAAAGTVAIAESQTAGRGRLGRSFYSPAHRNLYNSIVLRPEISLAEAPTLILSSGVAVAESVAETMGPELAGRVELKWPNDVLVAGRKTSGILMEMGAEETRVAFAILGIGVNLNVLREELPEEFRDRATSLRSEMGVPVARAEFTRRLYRKLEEILDAHAAGGFAAVRPRFDALFRMEGRRVTVEPVAGPAIEGRVAGVAADGRLLVEDAAGERHGVVAGDVTLAKEGGPA